MAVLLIILNTIFHQCETVVVKQYGKKYQNGGMFFNAIICLFSMFFFIVTDKGGFNFPKELWFYGLFSCAVYAAGFYYMYAALKVGSFALTKLLSSFSGIITIFYGIFVLKEDSNYLTYISIFMMFVSVFLMNYQKPSENKYDSQAEKKFSVKWLIYIIVVVLSNGLIGVVKKAQQIRFEGACDNEFLMVSLGGAFVFLSIFGLLAERKRLLSVLKTGSLYGALAGVCNGVTNFTSLILYSIISVSVVTPLITGLGIVAGFVISILFYKEKFTRLQYLSAVIGVIALVLLKISQ